MRIKIIDGPFAGEEGVITGMLLANMFRVEIAGGGTASVKASWLTVVC